MVNIIKEEILVEESLKNKKYMLKGVCSQYPIAGS